MGEGQSSQPSEVGRTSQRLAIFCNFSIKITHFYAYFSQNSYFKAITHQLKALNEVQVL